MPPKRGSAAKEPASKRTKVTTEPVAKPITRGSKPTRESPEKSTRGAKKVIEKKPTKTRGSKKEEEEEEEEEEAEEKKEKETKPPTKKKVAASKARASDAELDKELDAMIQHAKDGEFAKVFEVLDKYPPYVNEKPEERMFCTLHQACFWGELDAVKTLVEKYNADVFLPTKDGKLPIEVAKAEGHTSVVKYLEGKSKKKPAVVATSRDANTDRNRITTTRNDGKNEEPDLKLDEVKKVTLTLGAGKGILCGAALVFGGAKRQKAVCMSDRNFATIKHSGDTKDSTGRSLHTIHIDLPKMPKAIDKIYLTLCSCGADNLSKFDRPGVDLLGDGEPLIRYDLSDAGTAVSTVMAVLEKSKSGHWSVSPVGAVSPAKFCGNYHVADALIASANT